MHRHMALVFFVVQRNFVNGLICETSNYEWIVYNVKLHRVDHSVVKAVPLKLMTVYF